MRLNKNLVVGIGAMACLAFGAQQAKADMLYDGVGFLEGSQAFTDSFSVSQPGTLTVTLGDLDWPSPLASLNLMVSTPSGSVGPEMTGPGTATFNVSSGNVVAQWFGTAASGGLDTGAYSLEIQFTPGSGGSGASPVPLPTSVGLLLSGLVLLLWQRRTRTSSTLEFNNRRETTLA